MMVVCRLLRALLLLVALLAQFNHAQGYDEMAPYGYPVKRSDFFMDAPQFKGLRGMRGKRMPYMNLKGLRGKRNL